MKWELIAITTLLLGACVPADLTSQPQTTSPTASQTTSATPETTPAVYSGPCIPQDFTKYPTTEQSLIAIRSVDPNDIPESVAAIATPAHILSCDFSNATTTLTVTCSWADYSTMGDNPGAEFIGFFLQEYFGYSYVQNPDAELFKKSFTISNASGGGFDIRFDSLSDVAQAACSE